MSLKQMTEDELTEWLMSFLKPAPIPPQSSPCLPGFIFRRQAE